nr:(-)-alpha-terpineol synthase-like [Ipomoea batatas]
MLENVKKASSDQLELIDVVQRLGLSYHFNREIQQILASLHTMMNNNVEQKIEDLCKTALQFRLLRQEGYQVSQDIFKAFINEEGKFDMKLCGNTKGMLSLYEASYLTMEDEHILEMAKEFTTYHLKQTLKQGIDENMAEQDEMARGDTSKSIQCYMQETGRSEDDAHNMMREMVEATWKKMNKEILMDTHFCRDYVQTAMNLARISQCMYQYGDGYGRPDGVTKDRIKSLFFEPIPLA